MALPSVGQAALLGTALQRTVDRFLPASLAVLGVAGGNGLAGLDRGRLCRVVGVDFHPDYLALCSRRFAASFTEFEAVLHDLSQGPPGIAPVECVFAGLVLEYLCVETVCGYLASLLTPGGHVAFLLQLPSPTIPEVSPSPFASLACLESAFRFVDPAELDDLLKAQGFTLLAHDRYDLESGKSFYYAAYEAMNGGETECRPSRPTGGRP